MRIDPHQGISVNFISNTGTRKLVTSFLRENWFHSKHFTNQNGFRLSKATLESRTLETCLQNGFQLRILYVQSNYQGQKLETEYFSKFFLFLRKLLDDVLSQHQQRNRPRKRKTWDLGNKNLSWESENPGRAAGPNCNRSLKAL